MNSPYSHAHSLLDYYCINTPESINLSRIADGELLVIKEEDLVGYLGKIIFLDNCGIITIDSKIRDLGQRRFTIAHEFGHFFLERKKKNLINHSCTTNDIFSGKPSVSDERKANEFAAELLMPAKLFSSFIKDEPVSSELIFESSAKFRVSITAAAIRYAEIGQYPIALVMSTNGHVSWSCINRYFPLKYIEPNTLISKISNAYDYFSQGKKATGEDVVLAKAWFPSDFKCLQDMYLHEQNIYFSSFNAVLTILREYKV